MGSQATATAKITSIQDHKLMKEEKASYGFMKFPNWFVDERLKDVKSFPELKVIMVIFRMTVGFQKKSDKISYSQFQKITGMTPTSIADGLKQAIEHGYIKREQAGQAWSYSLEPLALGYELDDTTTSPRLVVPLAPGECFDEKPLALGYTQKKVFKDNINKGGEDTVAIAPGPQKSTTIDLEETFYYPGYQPETVPDPEPTTAPTMPTSRQEAKQTYPATPAPKTSKKVKGDSKPVAGAADAKVKVRDATLDHPAVIAYNEKFKLTPDPEQRDMIITQITDLGEWKEALDFWKSNKYRPLSVGKLLDCYRKGNYKNELPGTGKRDDRGRSEQANRHYGKNTANGTAVPGYWDRPAEEIEREWAEFKL